jgi:N-acetylglucosamine kinase-like BadF-type ATPase
MMTTRTFLIADSGGTKAAWALVRDGRVIWQRRTPGLPPSFLSDAEIIGLAKSVADQLNTLPEGVYFYGTGCRESHANARMKKLLEYVFPKVPLEVETDILGAARALCGHEEGIACILGTGSNACHCADGKILQNIGGLGFILGDEGSGAALGKTLLAAYLNQELPENLHHALEKDYALHRDEIIDAVYRKPAPNRYLAAFAPFVQQWLEHPYMAALAEQQFRAFFEKSVLKLSAGQSIPVHFTGSIACHFEQLIREIAQKMGLKTGVFLTDPIEGLAAFHR